MHIFLLCVSRVLPLKLELAYWTQQVFFYIKHIDRWMLYCSKAHNVQKRMNGNQVSPKVHQFLLQLWYCHDTTPVQFSIIYSDIHGCNFSKFAVKHENDVTLQLKRKMFEFNLFIFNFIEIHLSLYPDLLIYSTFHFFLCEGERNSFPTLIYDDITTFRRVMFSKWVLYTQLYIERIDNDV